MHNHQGFDYNQPSRDALVGIYVEVSDAADEGPGAESNTAQGGITASPEAERLFGLIVTADDDYSASHRPLPEDS